MNAWGLVINAQSQKDQNSFLLKGNVKVALGELLETIDGERFEGLETRVLDRSQSPKDPNFGTFVVRVTGLESDRTYGVLQGAVFNSSRIFWLADGTASSVEILRFAKPGNGSPEAGFGTYSPIFYKSFVPKAKNGYLLVQYSSNRPQNSGGLVGFTQPIELGNHEDLSRKFANHTTEAYFVLGMYILLFFYNLSIFIQRPGDKGSLAIAVIAFGFCCRHIATSGILNLLIPISEDTARLTGVLMTTSPAIATGSLLVLVRVIFPESNWRYMSNLLLLPYPFIILGTLALDFTQNMLIWTQITYFEIVSGIYCIAVMVRALIRREIGSVLASIGMFFLIACHCFDGLIALQIVESSFYTGHYSMVLFIFCQSLILGKRFALTYQESQTMSLELQDKNESLLAQQSHIKALNEELNLHNEKLEDLVLEKTRDIRSILNSIEQGIVTITTAQGNIGEESSRFFQQLFPEYKTELNQDIIDLCFSKMEFSKDQLNQIRARINSIVKEPDFAFIANSAELPRQGYRTLGNKRQNFELDWNAILNEESETVEKILLTVRDVTSLAELKEASQRQELELVMITEIIGVSSIKFAQFLRDSSNLILDSESCLTRFNDTGEGMNCLYRNIHTLKGVARGFRLNFLTEAIHNLEEHIKAQQQGQVSDLSDIENHLRHLKHLLGEYRDLNNNKLGRLQSINDELIAVPRDELVKGLKLLESINPKPLPQRDQLNLQAFQNQMIGMAYLSFREVIEDQIDSMESIAAELGKDSPMIVIDDNDIHFSHSSRDLLNKIYTHLIRNALDHGIESRDERLALGKIPRGCLFFYIQLEDDRIIIDMHDDGRGLDHGNIIRKAQSAGILKTEDPLSSQQVADLLLLPGFSTTQNISNISGRGIGLDAVEAFAKNAGGSLNIKVVPSRHHSPRLHFVLEIPLSLGTKISQVA